jgi:FkbM family methyltransferase
MSVDGDHRNGFERLGPHVQQALLTAYNLAAKYLPAIVRPDSHLFPRLYFLYKRRIEAAGVEALRPLVRSGTTVIDGGANIGFHSIYFDHWVGEGKVIALEPDARNFEMLNRTIRRYGLKHVETIRAAVTRVDGPVRLKVDPLHPGNHRISTTGDGVEVPGVTIDRILAERGWPEVSLIKIDTQGSELDVLRGAPVVIERSHPALVIEIDEKGLGQQGASLGELLLLLKAVQYEAYAFDRSGWTSLGGEGSIREYVDRRRFGYADLLFLPSGETR